ncbi:tetratricopeptide repeat-containing protein [Streptomyces sp. MST-110588]|uniref:tetratricopeptide repeat-containing protein n=1 Tax=Streptomyces sp. MST-110588 TaxID=2833628 RepID=UPI003242CE02
MGFLVLRLDPTARREETPAAFVAMPYGTRADATRGLNRLEADETWRRVLVPALYDSGYRPIRSDIESHLDTIDINMLSDINRSDLFVADLATLNPNVFWELGVRHAWVPSGTLLLAPRWVTAPFDINHARVHPYDRGMKTVSDRQAVAAIRTVRAALNGSCGETSSPVWAVFPHLEPVRLPARPDPGLSRALTRRTEQISLAVDLRDEHRLTALARELCAQDLPLDSRHALLEMTGLALVSLGRYEAGRAVLEQPAAADTAFSRIRLQQQYALTLIHSEAPTSAQRLADLREAELRLLRLDQRHPQSSETQALLGSAAKQTWLLSLQLGERQHEAHLARAIDAYSNGTAVDPGDYYPGINAVSLLRLRAQYFGGGTEDLDAARDLLPVVRFAVRRRPGPRNVWEHATLGEIALNEHLLRRRPNGASHGEGARDGAARDGTPRDGTRVTAPRVTAPRVTALRAAARWRMPPGTTPWPSTPRTARRCPRSANSSCCT